MKKTLFLAALLGASLGFSNVSWAEIHYLDDDNEEFDVEDYIDDHDVDEWAWVIDADPSYYLYYGGQFIVEKDCEGTITNGAVANKILIKEGATLTMDPGYDDEDRGRLWQVAVNSTKLDEADMPKYSLHIHMENNATLKDNVTDLKLGAFTFEEGADVTITAGNLLAKDIMCEYFTDANDPRVSRNFLINANLNVRDETTLVMDSMYAKSVTLGYDQTMNLAVTSYSYRPSIDNNGVIHLNVDGVTKDYYRLHLDSTAGSDAKLILPDGATSTIGGYLGGSATISLGNGTKVVGHDEVEAGNVRYVSWLTNKIEVRENCSAVMTAGYYGGNITMLEGSSLQFYMGLAPAGVDEELWHGGAGVFMKGGNTLDIGGGAHTFALIVEGGENTVSHGTLLWNESSTGSASITNASLTLKNDLTMAENATVFLKGDATLDMGGQKRAFVLTVTGDENKLTNGSFIGTLTLAEDSTLISDSAMASWDGPTSIVMNNGSTLEMVPGQGQDICINNPSAIQVNGEATINNAYLVLRTNNRPNHEYVLDDGVASLEGNSSYLLPGDEAEEHFNLNNHTANFGIIVWESGTESDISISNGTIDKSVLIRNTSGSQTNGKLSLRNVTIGDNATFTMENKTQLDLGGASVKLDKVTLAEDATATVDNGTLWIGTGETVTLDPNLGGNYALDLRGGTLQLDNATLTRDTIVSGEAWVSGGTVDNSIQILGTSDERPISKLWLEEDVTIGDNATFTMGNGAKLDMSGNTARLSKFTLEESATAYVYGGTLFVGEGEEATLNPNLLGSCVLELRGGTLNLGTNTLDRKANVTGDATIRNGKIDFAVNIDSSRKLSLQDMKVASNAAFTMGDGAQMNLGKVKEEYTVTTQSATWLQERNGIGLNMFTFTGESARIDNGTLFVGDHVAGFNETYTLGTNLTGSADMKLDYYKTCLKFGGHQWTMTQSNGTEIFTMEDNTGHTGSIFGEANVKAQGLVGQYVQEKVQVQGVKLTTKSDFRVEKAVISGSLIDIGVGTKLFLVDVDIKADTHFTDDTATLSVDNTNAWLEQDVNTFVAGSETVAADTTLRMSGDKSDTPQSITMAAGSQVINLTCDMFDSVTLTGADVWLDMTDIAERGTLLGYGYVTIDFGHVGDQLGDVLKRAMVDARNLSVYAKLVDDKGQAYTERAYYDPATLAGGYAPRLFFKLVDTPEPTTGVLSLLGLGLLAGRRRRHN